MNKSDIEFAHDAIQAILNTDKTIVGTATVVKDATNGKNAEDIAIVAANTVHSAAELFSKLSVIGVVVNGIEAFNTIYNNWNTSSTSAVNKSFTACSVSGLSSVARAYILKPTDKALATSAVAGCIFATVVPMAVKRLNTLPAFSKVELVFQLL
jgi:hypothetical protein